MVGAKSWQGHYFFATFCPLLSRPQPAAYVGSCSLPRCGWSSHLLTCACLLSALALQDMTISLCQTLLPPEKAEQTVAKLQRKKAKDWPKVCGGKSFLTAGRSKLKHLLPVLSNHLLPQTGVQRCSIVLTAQRRHAVYVLTALRPLNVCHACTVNFPVHCCTVARIPPLSRSLITLPLCPCLLHVCVLSRSTVILRCA
jgi:hypothetical protein